MSRTVGRLLDEGVATARAYRASSLTIALVAAVMCLLVFGTAGRSAASADRILSRIDEAGARLVTITTQQGFAGMDVDVVPRLAAIDGVAGAVGLGSPRDVHNAAVPGGDNVTARAVHGDLGDRVRLVTGRLPAPGEAVVAPDMLRRLGMDGPVGTVTDGTLTVTLVGTVQEDAPLTGLSDYVLVGDWVDPHGNPLEDAPLVTLALIVVDRATDVPALIPVIRSVSGVDDPALIAIRSSPDLVEVQEVVSGDFGELSRQLGIAAVAAGLVVVGLTMVLSVTARRRDIGRRRALGATRSAVLVLVAVQAVVPAAVGAVVGTAGGVAVVLAMAGNAPAADMTAAVPLLAVVAAAVGSLPAAALAALRDPVAVLRVP